MYIGELPNFRVGRSAFDILVSVHSIGIAPSSPTKGSSLVSAGSEPDPFGPIQVPEPTQSFGFSDPDEIFGNHSL